MANSCFFFCHFRTLLRMFGNSGNVQLSNVAHGIHIHCLCIVKYAVHCFEFNASFALSLNFAPVFIPLKVFVIIAGDTSERILSARWRTMMLIMLENMWKTVPPPLVFAISCWRGINASQNVFWRKFHLFINFFGLRYCCC